MSIIKVLILCIIVLYHLCTAQIINISGTVRGLSGESIPGASVRLEKIMISTKTDADGNFVLRNTESKAEKKSFVKTASGNSVFIKRSVVSFAIEKRSGFSFEIFGINGKRILYKQKIYNSGKHSFELPEIKSGIYLFRIFSCKHLYNCMVVKTGAGISRSKLVSEHVFSTNLRIKPTGKTKQDIIEFLTVTKEEMLDYKIAIKSIDTSGIEVKMIPNAGNVTDIDGNIYQSVQIGNQIWAAENLKTTKYNDGTAITHVPDSAAWCEIYLKSRAVDAYCIYGDSTAKNAKYGLFYNWYAVGTGKLAPKGWRVPSEADWDKLQNYLVSNGYNYDGSVNDNRVAKSMAAQWDWEESTLEGAVGNDLRKNNASGFSALPGGLRHWGGSYYSKFLGKSVTYLWSSTEHDSIRAWHIHIDSHKNYIDRITHNKNTGFPVRIVRDVN